MKIPWIARGRHAEEAGDRQCELRLAHAVQLAHARGLDQPDRRGDHDGRQGAIGKVRTRLGRTAAAARPPGAHDPGHLRLGAGGLGDRGPRGAAADREPLEEAGGDVGRAEADQLLVRVDVGPPGIA